MADLFSEVKQRISTREVAAHAGVTLKRIGTRLVGLCPLHQEKSPSFLIFPDGGWKCFGCQISGQDAVALYARLHGLRPIEAARILSAQLGIISGEYRPPAVNISDIYRGLRFWKTERLRMLIDIHNSIKRYLRTYDPDEAFDNPFFVKIVMVCAELDVQIEKLEYQTDDELLQRLAEYE